MTETLPDLDLGTEGDVDFVSAVEDPAAVEEAARRAQDGETGPTLPLPLDGPVTLPGGFRRLVPGSSPKFENVTKAWVKELDGFAEEKIARAQMQKDFSEVITTVLQHGVERLGDVEPTLPELRDLLAGDREFLLVQISKATYGDRISWEKMVCPHCGEMFDVSIGKSEQIPVIRLKSPEDATFTFKTRKGVSLTVHYPSGAEQSKAFDLDTGAEANTALLANIVDDFAGDQDEARRLSLGDRNALMEELGKNNPGPRYTEVRFPHEPDGCGKEVRLTVTFADLFPGL